MYFRSIINQDTIKSYLATVPGVQCECVYVSTIHVIIEGYTCTLSGS